MSTWKSSFTRSAEAVEPEEKKILKKSASDRRFNTGAPPPQPQQLPQWQCSSGGHPQPSTRFEMGASRSSKAPAPQFVKSEYNNRNSRKTLPPSLLEAESSSPSTEVPQYGKIPSIAEYNRMAEEKKRQGFVEPRTSNWPAKKETITFSEEEEDSPYVRIKPKPLITKPQGLPRLKTNQTGNNTDTSNQREFYTSIRPAAPQPAPQPEASSSYIKLPKKTVTQPPPEETSFVRRLTNLSPRGRDQTIDKGQSKLENSPQSRKEGYGFTTDVTNRESKEQQIINCLTAGSFKKGYLWKQGKENTRWRRRWFCLKGNSLLYFENAQEAKCTGKFTLESDFQVWPTDSNDTKRLGKRDFTFKLTGVSLKAPRYLAAESEEDKNEWMTIFKESIDCIRREFNRPSHGSDFVSIKEGTLFKQGPQRTGWDKRFFLLKGNFLQYYKSTKDPLPVGLINIGECKSIEEVNDAGKPFAFVLNHPNRKFFLAAENLSSKEEWLHHIKTAMGLKSSLSSNLTSSNLKVSQNIPRESFLCKPIKEGVLYKDRKANHLTSILTKENTKPVRLVLTHNFLYYFPSASTTETKYHSIHLEDLEVDPIPEDFARIPHSFRINSLLRPLLVSAEDEVEFKRWINLVEAAKQNLEYRPESKTDTEIKNNLNIDYIVQVLSETVDKEGQKFYDIRVKAFWTEWVVQRSYDDILGLYINLYDQFPQYIFPEVLGETLLTQETEGISIRQRKLSKSVGNRVKSIINPNGKFERPIDEQWDLKYFQCLIRELVRNHQICQSETVQKFFELDDIFHAITRGEIAFVRYFIDQKKVPVSAVREKDDLSPLHFAVKCKSPKTILLALISAGASPNLINKKKQTPLHMAAQYSDVEIIELLVQRNSEIEAQTDQGQTALHIAAARGDSGIIRFLLEKNAKINATDVGKRTALHYAAIEGKLDALDLLLSHGADVEAVDSEGFTPLMIAIWKNSQQAAEKLLKANSPVTTQDHQRRNCLHLAVLRKSTQIVKLLVCYPELFDVANSSGLFPFHLAVQKGHDDIVELLLKKGVDPSVRVPESGQTPLHLACANNRSLMTETLLKAGAIIEARDIQGRSALHIATLQTATVLLDDPWKANPDVVDFRHQTPLHYAAASGSTATATLLLSHCPQLIDRCDKDQQTALHLAVNAGHEPTAKLLVLQYSADVNKVTPRGDTALHLAFKKNLINIALFLAEHGADLTLRNLEGQYGLSLAPRDQVKNLTDAANRHTILKGEKPNKN